MDVFNLKYEPGVGRMKLVYAGLFALLVVAVRAEDEAEGEDGVEFEDNTIYR